MHAAGKPRESMNTILLSSNMSRSHYYGYAIKDPMSRYRVRDALSSPHVKRIAAVIWSLGAKSLGYIYLQRLGIWPERGRAKRMSHAQVKITRSLEVKLKDVML